MSCLPTAPAQEIQLGWMGQHVTIWCRHLYPVVLSRCLISSMKLLSMASL